MTSCENETRRGSLQSLNVDGNDELMIVVSDRDFRLPLGQWPHQAALVNRRDCWLRDFVRYDPGNIGGFASGRQKGGHQLLRCFRASQHNGSRLDAEFPSNCLHTGQKQYGPGANQES